MSAPDDVSMNDLPMTDRFDATRRWRLRMPLALLALSGGAYWIEAGAAVRTLAARFVPGAGLSRIQFEFSAVPVYGHLMLRDPLRLVIDLQEVEPDGALREWAARLPAGDPLIAGVRVALNRPGVTRVVIELKQPVTPRFALAPPKGNEGHRLIVDLMPEGMAEKASAGTEKVPLAKPAGEAAARAGEGPVKPARKVTVVIDPGHGGEDPGAIGAQGTREKHITLAVAARLARAFEATGQVNCVLTRESDKFLALHQRVMIAREANADLFLSVHADAFKRRAARGSTVFALSEHGSSSAFAKYMAQRENQADLIGNAKFMPRDVFQTITEGSLDLQIRDSLKLAKGVIAEVEMATIMHSPRPEQAPFAVLKAPDIPSILIETGFLSNPVEEKLLNEASFQEKITRAVVAGVQRYIAKADLMHQPPNRWIDNKNEAKARA